MAQPKRYMYNTEVRLAHIDKSGVPKLEVFFNIDVACCRTFEYNKEDGVLTVRSNDVDKLIETLVDARRLEKSLAPSVRNVVAQHHSQ